VDEMGVILPDDNSQTAPVPPPIYWNAAGAMYAYLFGKMTPMGYDVLGESQLVGTPPIPQWGIPDAQFPSVSMLNWTTGEGNARYWVLKLLIDNFKAGDQLVETSSLGEPSLIMCGLVDGHYGYGNISILCKDPAAVINKIDFAAFGTPTGTCQHYHHDPKCDAKNVTEVVESMCLQKRTCSVLSYPTFGDPCYDVYKDFIIQAECSGAAGGYIFPNANGNNPPFAQGFVRGGTRRLLLVNKQYATMCVTVSGSSGSVMFVVDQLSGWGPARRVVLNSDSFNLLPFAVAVIVF